MVIYFSIAIYEKYVELKEETKAYVSNNRVKIIIDELSNFNENS